MNSSIVSRMLGEAEFISPFPGVVPAKKLSDQELKSSIRMSIATEHEAVHLYETLANSTDNAEAKKILQSVADEEKIHIGEFQRLLEKLAPDELELVDKGKKEASDS